ncbi:MAG: universal stress protein, partial [Oscillospiraceae bacterium]|nr:universal stress protein [Oscillospiraceae bacterium]
MAEHILVCLSGAPSNEKVIRASARLAEMAGGTFTALFVETPDLQRWSEADRQRLSSNRRLAEELGARITTVYGDEPAIQIAEYAKLSGVTRIVLGKSPANKLFGLKRTPLADRLCELLPEQDIYLISDRPGPARFSRYRQSAAIHLSLRDTLRMFA